MSIDVTTALIVAAAGLVAWTPVAIGVLYLASRQYHGRSSDPDLNTVIDSAVSVTRDLPPRRQPKSPPATPAPAIEHVELTDQERSAWRSLVCGWWRDDRRQTGHGH